jgi:hypothetical protein
MAATVLVAVTQTLTTATTNLEGAHCACTQSPLCLLVKKSPFSHRTLFSRGTHIEIDFISSPSFHFYIHFFYTPNLS